jgi:tetratricopeptide (TPR) repeat protein
MSAKEKRPVRTGNSKVEFLRRSFWSRSFDKRPTMREEKKETVRLVLAISLAVLLMATGIMIMVSGMGENRAYGFLYGLIGCAFIFVSALLLASPLSELFSIPFQRIFIPGRRYDRPLPMYSRAESLTKKERYEEAIAFYEEIERDYPEETRVYVSLIDVYIMQFGDRENAKRVFDRGLLAISDEEERKVLQEMYSAICSRIDEPKEWGHGKKISVEAQIHSRKERAKRAR